MTDITKMEIINLSDSLGMLPILSPYFIHKSNNKNENQNKLIEMFTKEIKIIPEIGDWE